MFYIFRKNEKLIECIANRAACHLALFNFRECINDCNEVLEYLSKMSSQKEENENLMKLEKRLKARKAVALSWEGSDESFLKAQEIFDDLLKSTNETDPIFNQIKTNYQFFQNRISSIESKVF